MSLLLFCKETACRYLLCDFSRRRRNSPSCKCGKACNQADAQDGPEGFYGYAHFSLSLFCILGMRHYIIYNIEIAMTIENDGVGLALMMANIFNIPIPKTIVLIGMMGVGKTSIGRRLARRLDLKFRDSDHEVEQAAACSVADIFSLYGENAFHDVERRVIQRLLSEQPCILATGGSAFAVHETRDLIKKNAISIWLKADIETILPRIERRDHRPQFVEGSARTTLEKLISTYHPLYAEADIQVPCDNSLPDATVEKIIIELNRYMSKLEMERGQKITHV